MIDNGNGTVTSKATGLMWQQETVKRTMTWKQALSNCEKLSLAGYTDWRMPTIKELGILADYNRYNPAINTKYFPGTVSSFYWSSTTYAYNPFYAWGVNFYDGNDSFGDKSLNCFVRAVREVYGVVQVNYPYPKGIGASKGA